MSDVALEGFGGGGGASLNFKVKDYATEELLMAATGKDNEIGIITSTPITGWYMAAEQPEMQPGEVWISTGTASPVAFNVLKKGTVMVYPLSAKQMQADGTLADVTAKSWQNGEWVDWYNGELYYNGNQYESITGGFTVVKNNGFFTFNDNDISFGFTGNSSTQATLYTKNKVDLQGYTKLCIDIDATTVTVNDVNTAFGLCDSIADAYPDQIAYKGTHTRGRQTLELDISGYQGAYYVSFKIAASAGKIFKIWRE